jgi:hypothetical protein
MCIRPLATAVIVGVIGLVARPAAAQLGAPPSQPDAAHGEAPSGREQQTAPAAVDAERIRELQLQLFAQESLQFEGSSIMRSGTPVHVTTFYALIGRPDLNDLIRARAVTKTAIGVAWGALDVLGTNLDNALKRPWSCGSADPRPECADRSQASPFPWLVAASGGVLMVIGFALPSDPLGRAEKDALISDYNQRLRVRMGLSSALEAAKRTASVKAVVLPNGQSGMLLASCSF